MNVVFHLTLLLGLFVSHAHAGARDDQRTSGPPAAAAEQPAGPAHAGLIEPVALEPDSAGTGYVAPVQYIYGQHVDSQRRLDRQTGVGSVLESGQWSGQGLNAAEILGEAAGLYVSSTGGLGATASVQLRGSSSAQVPVYLDGVLLNRPDANGVNIGALNPESLERIEVYRGTAPLTLGGGSMGGAIHLYTGDGRGSVLGSVTARSYGGLVFEGGGSTTASQWTLGLRGRVLRAENDWEFDDDRGTIYNPDDDTRARRINNDVRGGGGVASARRPLGRGQFTLSATADVTEQGLPGYSIRQSETARGSSLLGQGQARWMADRAASTRWREATFYARIDRQGYEDPGGDLSGRVRDRTDEVITVGTALSGAFSPVAEAAWRLELSRAAQQSEDKALSDGDFPQRDRWMAAIAIEPAWHLFDDRLVLSPGARLERNLDSEDGGDSSTLDAITYQFGARWSLHPNLFLKGNIGHFERVPSLFELFGDRGSVVGNAGLTPESGINRDLGFVYSASGTGSRVAFSWFVNDAFDLILPVQINPVSVKYQNLARADIEGLELEASSGRIGAFQARLAFTRLWTADRSGRSYAEGHPLPGRPGLVLDAALFSYLGGWTAGVDFTAMDENFAQTGGRAPIPSRSLVGLSLRRSLGPDWFALARVDNVGDTEVFDLYGYPLPGQQFSLSLQKVH